MAKIKSHTDIEQSKKLAEILPLESADHFHIIGHLHTDGPRYEVIRSRNEVVETDKYWPCWSLAALFNVLPNGTDISKADADTENERYMCTVGINGDIISTFAENPVDACVEMIIKLHKLNLL